MQDIDFVIELLKSDYRTHLPNENPYPDLEELIARTDFDFPTGQVEGQRENGAFNRDEISYLFFPDSDKRILVHRFIVAVALGKWPPRDLDVHHLNDKPDDNRPTNLELVTRRYNNAVRRAPLKKVADLTKANRWVSEISKVEKQAPKQAAKKPKPTILSPDSPIEAFARVPEKDITSVGIPQSNQHLSYFVNKRVPSIEEVLRRYYTVPDDVSWTGRRKGVEDCYWEATTGIWYYVDPRNAP
ncbi:HNH endonuclease signature motif containing protein [Ruegeria sp. SCPT10]|uniref:HNH endonuclease signature motif containing protein n=1 Tax=Ruegeria sp. SCP10 TaxID=3141377 RepID=UPI0033391736